MNSLANLNVSASKFACVPKDMKQIVVTCKTQAQVMEAFKTGHYPADAVVTQCNFDWQNDPKWIAHTIILWETA